MTTTPHARTRPRNRALLPTIVILAVVVIAFVIYANIWTDLSWFSELHASRVFWVRIAAGAGLFFSVAIVAAAVVATNAIVAFNMGPKAIRSTQLDALAQLRMLLRRKLKPVVIGFSAIVGLIMGFFSLTQIDVFLAWWNRTSFGVVDPYFGHDISFFIFGYPWWTWLVRQLLFILAVALVVSLVVHAAVGAVRVSSSARTSILSLRGPGPLTDKAQRHVSILLGSGFILYAIILFLSRYELSFDSGSLLTGITYTDQHANIGAYTIMSVISLLIGAVFIANFWLKRWSLPIIGLVLMVASSLIITMIYPMIIQRFNVRPDEPTKEAPFIQKHLEATKDAYAIRDLEIEHYTAETEVSAGQLKADAEALPGIRLMDPSLLSPTFEQMQQVRGYYSFPSTLDVDRYTIDGNFTDAVVAVREMTLEGIDNSWNNVHTVYTHGYGLVASYGNRRQDNGLPVWIQGEIPPQGVLGEHQGRIYYGQESKDFVIVGREAGSPPVELDTPGGGESGGEKYNVYDGSGGVPVGSLWRKMLFATSQMDLNILLSDRVNSESKILYNRIPQERVQKVAPWLELDKDPFPAVVDGRTVWIIDGYTTASTYPNSHTVDLNQLRAGATNSDAAVASKKINYIRNSVKATVDAYDGTVNLYAWDETDPILQTWMKTYPGLVKSKTEISDDLLQHLRYPTDLFKVQRDVVGRYHTNSVDTWYQLSDMWVIPDDPTPANAGYKERPYYLSIKWPGDDKAVFSLTTVYVPQARQNLSAYMAVNADASSKDYGKLRVLKLSDQRQIDGPGQTFNAMKTDDRVASALLPFTSRGTAEVKYGNLLTLPLGGGLIYIQPIYTVQNDSSGAYPVLRFVVARFGTHIAIGDTLQEALDGVFRGDAGASTGEEDTQNPGDNPEQPDNPPTETVQMLLEQANQSFDAAAEAMKNGDLGSYQKHIDEAKAKIQRALELESKP